MGYVTFAVAVVAVPAALVLLLRRYSPKVSTLWSIVIAGVGLPLAVLIYGIYHVVAPNNDPGDGTISFGISGIIVGATAMPACLAVAAVATIVTGKLRSARVIGKRNPKRAL